MLSVEPLLAHSLMSECLRVAPTESLGLRLLLSFLAIPAAIPSLGVVPVAVRAVELAGVFVCCVPAGGVLATGVLCLNSDVVLCFRMRDSCGGR